MDNATNASTIKICTVLAFVCAALMMSIIVYRLNHQKDTPQAASDKSLLFPAGRDINDFSLVNSKKTAFTKNDLRQHWTLLFFGYTHCPTVCPATLGMLSQTYKQLHDTYPNLQIVLVSLDPERDNSTTLANYTAHFHPNIIGVSGSLDELRKLQGQLGIYVERSDNRNTNYILQHTPSILLINPQGKWVGLFKFGMNANDFIHEFNTNIKQLAKFTS